MMSDEYRGSAGCRVAAGKWRMVNTRHSAKCQRSVVGTEHSVPASLGTQEGRLCRASIHGSTHEHDSSGCPQ